MADEWILKTIVAKSDQLNACDLVGGPICVTITSVKEGPSDQPVILGIGKDYQPYKPCLSMRRVLVNVWGLDNTWVGRKLVLYCHPPVKFGGEEVGGIRISNMSHIDKPVVTQLNLSRGKKGTWTVAPIAAGDISERVSKVLKAIGEAGSKDEIDKIKRLSKAVYDESPEHLKVEIEAAFASWTEKS